MGVSRTHFRDLEIMIQVRMMMLSSQRNVNDYDVFSCVSEVWKPTSTHTDGHEDN